MPSTAIQLWLGKLKRTTGDMIYSVSYVAGVDACYVTIRPIRQVTWNDQCKTPPMATQSNPKDDWLSLSGNRCSGEINGHVSCWAREWARDCYHLMRWQTTISLVSLSPLFRSFPLISETFLPYRCHYYYWSRISIPSILSRLNGKVSTAGSLVEVGRMDCHTMVHNALVTQLVHVQPWPCLRTN